MASLPITIPEAELGWARSRVEAGKAPSVEAYFADLARRDQEESEEIARIQALLDEGDASGVDPRPGEQIMAEVRGKYFGANG